MDFVPNRIAGTDRPASDGGALDKIAPADGRPQSRLARSTAADVALAVEAARAAQAAWAALPAPSRGRVLLGVARALEQRADEVARIVAAETGKSVKDALGETGGAVRQGEFFAGEGTRLHGRTLQSGVPGKETRTVRQPLGVAGLIVAANTPIANVAWKVFPALICGNATVLKAPEDTPATAWVFARIAEEAGLPPGVLNVVQGLGAEAGAALVEHPGVDVLSFTGSTAVGRRIAESAGRRLVRVSLELGGKNPLVVCDDADLDRAVRWTALSAFSNAGQRCASASRIIVMAGVWDAFRALLLERVAKLSVGGGDADDLGPVINERQMRAILAAVEAAVAGGARLLTGGRRLGRPGWHIAPTLLEDVAQGDPIHRRELFGPVAALYRAASFDEAVALANDTDYGLTAAVHTRDLDRALLFGRRVRAGAVNVNGGTYGSEPHFPFGGFGASGNGTREPGVEALDVYSELKCLSFLVEE